MRTFVVAILFLGLVSSVSTRALAAGAQSPTGTWMVAMSGADSGLVHLTFSNDFTWTGYGISKESFGGLTIVGNWTNDNKGEVAGSYTETFPDTAIGWSMAAKIPGGDKFLGTAVSRFNHRLLRLRPKGKPDGIIPDISGNWNAPGKARGDRFIANYTLTASTNMPGWFDLAGQVSTANGTSTVSGAVMVNTDRQANGYFISDFSSSVTTTSSFSGRFNAPLTKIAVVGRDDRNRFLVMKAKKE